MKTIRMRFIFGAALVITFLGAVCAQGPALGAPLPASPSWLQDGALSQQQFGGSVASAGDVDGDGYADVIVGSPGANRAQIFEGSPSGLSPAPAWTANGAPYSRFGASVASAGDINGDGYDDVVVGDPDFSIGPGISTEGAAYVFYGSSVGVSTTPGWTAVGEAVQAHFGNAVACAGDFNGDGYADIVVGSADYYPNGRIYLYLGSRTGLPSTPNARLDGEALGSAFGFALSGAGDVNNDGLDDVIVGAPRASRGAVYLYFGQSRGVPRKAAWSFAGGKKDLYVGWSVGSAGDVNRDGYADVIAGSAQYTNGQAGEGAAYVFHGGSRQPSVSPNWRVESNQVSASLGVSVGSVGDINGDGYSDVIVGAPYFDAGSVDEGRAFVYLGSAHGLGKVAAWTSEADQDGARWGWSVAGAGDVNRDGFSDVLIGAPSFDPGFTLDAGRAAVYYGGP